MTLVYCSLEDCKNNKNSICEADAISIYEGGIGGSYCENYEDVTEGADYQHIFYEIVSRHGDRQKTSRRDVKIAKEERKSAIQ